MSGPTLFQHSEAIHLLDGLLNDLEERKQKAITDAKEAGVAFSPAAFEAEEDALIKEALLANMSQARDKIDGLCAYRQELLATAEARKAEASRLSGLAKTGENRADRIKSMIQWFFEDQKIDKLETPRFKLGIQANGGRIPMVWDNPDDPGAALPTEFVRIVRQPLTDTIYQKLSEGYTVPGVHLGEAGKHLRIR